VLAEIGPLPESNWTTEGRQRPSALRGRPEKQSTWPTISAKITRLAFSADRRWPSGWRSRARSLGSVAPRSRPTPRHRAGLRRYPAFRNCRRSIVTALLSVHYALWIETYSYISRHFQAVLILSFRPTLSRLIHRFAKQTAGRDGSLITHSSCFAKSRWNPSEWACVCRWGAPERALPCYLQFDTKGRNVSSRSLRSGSSGS
jgi:hypothetical protein